MSNNNPPYIVDLHREIVVICCYCPNKAEMEAKAEKEWPDLPISHGVCSDCLQKFLEENKLPSLDSLHA